MLLAPLRPSLEAAVLMWMASLPWCALSVHPFWPSTQPECWAWTTPAERFKLQLVFFWPKPSHLWSGLGSLGRCSFRIDFTGVAEGCCETSLNSPCDHIHVITPLSPRNSILWLSVGSRGRGKAGTSCSMSKSALHKQKS